MVQLREEGKFDLLKNRDAESYRGKGKETTKETVDFSLLTEVDEVNARAVNVLKVRATNVPFPDAHSSKN
jgi:hypothetical protein